MQDSDIWTQVQYEVVQTMLRVRGYTTISLLEPRKVTLDGQGIARVGYAASQKRKIGVYVCTEGKVGVKAVRRICDEGQAREDDTILLISANGLTPFASRYLTQATRSIHVQVMKAVQLAHNILSHKLVPPHRALTPTEKKDLLTALDCSVRELPKIRESDPIVQYCGWSPGTVIRIERRMGNLEMETYYRAVVKG